MEPLEAALAASFETAAFLDHFNDLQDHRQSGKVTYPLDEIAAFVCCGLGGGGGFHRHRALRREEARVTAPLPPVRRRDAEPRPLGRYFRHAGRPSLPTLLRGLGCGADQDAGGSDRHRRQDVPPFRQEGIEGRHSHWCRLSRRDNVSCWRRPRSATSRARLSPFPPCSTCCRSRARSSPSTRSDASARLRGRSSTRRPTTSWR